jgi:hypothetical protein
MSWGALSCRLSFTSDSSLKTGLHLFAAVGGGPPHRFEVDSGSVGMLVPRRSLGPDYQSFDPSLDTQFGLVSSGNSYWGQWVRVPIVLGVPPTWDKMGEYPSAEVEVFAVDQPTDFDGGLLGVGFAIGGTADGGPRRNPLLQLTYQGESLHRGYIIESEGLEVGLTSLNTNGFNFIKLQRNDQDSDWMQPIGSIGLPGGFSVDLPILIDTGLEEMLLWLDVAKRPPSLADLSRLPTGVAVTIAAPPVLQYSFLTGDPSNPMAPPFVEWRSGNGINTGRHPLAGADYLYDAVAGLVGIRMPPLGSLSKASA